MQTPGHVRRAGHTHCGRQKHGLRVANKTQSSASPRHLRWRHLAQFQDKGPAVSQDCPQQHWATWTRGLLTTYVRWVNGRHYIKRSHGLDRYPLRLNFFLLRSDVFGGFGILFHAFYLPFSCFVGLWCRRVSFWFARSHSDYCVRARVYVVEGNQIYFIYFYQIRVTAESRHNRIDIRIGRVSTQESKLFCWSILVFPRFWEQESGPRIDRENRVDFRILTSPNNIEFLAKYCVRIMLSQCDSMIKSTEQQQISHCMQKEKDFRTSMLWERPVPAYRRGVLVTTGSPSAPFYQVILAPRFPRYKRNLIGGGSSVLFHSGRVVI